MRRYAVLEVDLLRWKIIRRNVCTAVGLRDSWGQEKVSWIVLPTNYQAELANSTWVIKHALIPA